MNKQNLLQFILNPKFLRKIDRYLLLNRPFIWSTRVHYVSYYGLLINIILILLTLILIQPNQIDELTQFIVLFLFLFEIGVFFFWMFRQSIFNLEQEYGKQKHFFKRSILEITTYAFCILIIFSPSVVIPLSAMYKVANQIGINKDISCKNKIFMPLMNFNERNSFLLREKELLATEKELLATEKELLARAKEDLGYRSKRICSDIQYFVTGVDSYNQDKNSEKLPYDVYLFIQTFFISTIGIPVLIIQKYGNWRVVSWMSLYAIILSAFIMPVLIILDTLSVNIPDLDFGIIELEGLNANFFVIILVITFFVFLQSIKMLKRNSYSSILVVNCGILSSMLNLLLLGILIAHKNYEHPGHFLPYFLGFLVIYACLFSFQKKMLLRNFSLPKGS